MFNISFWEILIILVVALIVIDPKRLPETAHAVGKWVRWLRNQVIGIKTDIQRELDEEEYKQAHSKAQTNKKDDEEKQDTESK